jgi:hypothetical protein
MQGIENKRNDRVLVAHYEKPGYIEGETDTMFVSHPELCKALMQLGYRPVNIWSEKRTRYDDPFMIYEYIAIEVAKDLSSLVTGDCELMCKMVNVMHSEKFWYYAKELARTRCDG